jgi:hypothetical protein
MKLLIDADALPNMIKEILFRASERKGLPAVFVANVPIRVPKTSLMSFILAKSGPDEADHLIAEMTEAGDLCITNDIPLAARVAEKGGTSINHRGEVIDRGNASEKLAMRNLMETLRGMDEVRGGPKPFSERDRREFANALDRILSRLPNRSV